MRDGQFRLLWTGISDSKKMKAIKGSKMFRLGCHLVFSWLLPWCDDDGRMPGEPLKILAIVVPNEDLSIKEIEETLAELHRVELIIWYQVQGERFIQVLDWDKYQRIRKDRYKPSIYPLWQPVDNQSSTNWGQKCNLSPSPSPSPTEDILSSKKLDHIPFLEIISYLNQKTGKHFSYKTHSYQVHIRSRWNEGKREEDFKKVVDIKFEKWSSDPKMIDYLRPETLFGTKMDSYLNEGGHIGKHKPW